MILFTCYSGVKDRSEVTVVTESFRKLVGHSGRVTNVVWSPHTAFRLSSSSYDGSVQVRVHQIKSAFVSVIRVEKSQGLLEGIRRTKIMMCIVA